MVETRYARSGDAHIAYQVHGTGPIDLVWIPSYFSHLDLQMEQPAYARFIRRLSTFARVIVFDKRGTGMSDPVAALPTLDERLDDVRAVLDAVGSERTTVMGTCEGGALATLFAATYPTRVDRLVLCNSFARATTAEGYPWGVPSDQWESYVEAFTSTWGDGSALDLFAPSAADDPKVQQWWPRYQRAGVSPGALRTLMLMNAQVDVSSVLSTVRAPALVMHASGDRICRADEGRYLAEKLPDATFVELSSGDHYPWFDLADRVAERLERFVTGTVADRDCDRVFATVLFTDLVDSTQAVARLGDKAWRTLLERFFVAVRRAIVAAGGREISTLGDGMLAAFDRPSAAIHAALTFDAAAAAVGLRARTGVHCGECEIDGDDLIGLTLHVAARITAVANAGEVLCSQALRDVAAPHLQFRDHGDYELKGVPGQWRLSVVKPAIPEQGRALEGKPRSHQPLMP